MDRIEVLCDDQWRERLTPEQYQVMRKKGTERAFTGKYWNEKRAGTYNCGRSGEHLFRSEVQLDSGSGWPSFFQPINDENVAGHVDRTYGMIRTEVTCKTYGVHLGHVFDDGPAPTDLSYCMNSVSINLEPEQS